MRCERDCDILSRVQTYLGRKEVIIMACTKGSGAGAAPKKATKKAKK